MREISRSNQGIMEVYQQEEIKKKTIKKADRKLINYMNAYYTQES